MKNVLNNINTNQVIKIVYLLIVFLSITGIVHAQPTDPGGEVDAPIDGGLSLLIAGGVGYGIKKMRKPQTPKGCSKKRPEKFKISLVFFYADSYFILTHSKQEE